LFTRFVDVGGVDTRCLVAGEEGAPALVLVHGLSLTSEIWVRNIDELARDFRVIAVDLLGHGFTRPADGKPVGMDAKIAHLGALLDTLGIHSVTLCGSSYGALIAINLFLRERERVDRLIVNGSGSAFNTEAQLTAFTDRIFANYRPRLTDSSPEMWRERLNGTVLDVRCLPCELLTVLPLCYAQPWAAGCWEEAVSTMRQPERFRPFRILDRLEQIDVPTLVVWGRDDKGGIYESAVAAVKRMPRAEMVVFEQCAHMPMMEHSGKYNALVREFLS
jgi:pimeloyl-ACP methyl ester carboxylesterase